MRHIKMTCACGGSIEIDDEKGTYIDNSKLDANNNKYTIQKQAHEWLAAHQGCLALKQKEQA